MLTLGENGFVATLLRRTARFMRRITIRRPLAIFCAAGFAFSLTACGNATETGLENVIESETGGDVDVDLDGDDGVSIQTEDGSFSSGATTELPEEWPGDVPEPDGLAITSAAVIGSGTERAINVTGTVDDEGFVESYGSALEAAGFNEDSTFESDGTISNVYSNDNFTVGVVYAGDQSENQVNLSVYSDS